MLAAENSSITAFDVHAKEDTAAAAVLLIHPPLVDHSWN